MTDRKEPATITDLERGLRFDHLLISINRHMSHEGAAYAQALVELLMDKGIIQAEEFETKVAAHREKWKGDPQVMLSKAPDKYDLDREIVIDCASRVHLCRAACWYPCRTKCRRNTRIRRQRHFPHVHDRARLPLRARPTPGERAARCHGRRPWF